MTSYGRKPEPAGKHRGGVFEQHRQPMTYKTNPHIEYLMVYRKETSKLIDWNLKQYTDDVRESSVFKGEYDSGSIWELQPTSNPEHPAVFPYNLARRVIEMYTYIGDLVLDPFAGLATTCCAASDTQRLWTGIEFHEEYARAGFNKLNNMLDQTCKLVDVRRKLVHCSICRRGMTVTPSERIVVLPNGNYRYECEKCQGWTVVDWGKL